MKIRKKLDSFLRLFCVGIACVAILSVSTFALIGSGIFDGVVKSKSVNDINSTGGVIETGKDDGGDNPSGKDETNPSGKEDTNPDGKEDTNPDGKDDTNPDGKDDTNPDGKDDEDSKDPNEGFDFKFVEKDNEIYIEKIGDRAIGEDGKLVIPSSTDEGKDVKGIIDGAGKYNEKITEIEFSENTKVVDDNAFDGAENVKKIVIKTEELYNSIDENLFGIGKDKRSNIEIWVKESVDSGTNQMLSDTDYYLVDTSTINDEAYNRYYYNTTDYKIVKGVVYGFTTAGAKKNLRTINLNKEYTANIEVTSIASSAFEGNLYVRELIIGEGINVIGTYAFYNNASLRSIKVESETRYAINRAAFLNCTSLVSAELGNVWRIGMFAFKGCSNLSQENSSIRNNAGWSYYISKKQYVGFIQIIESKDLDADKVYTSLTNVDGDGSKLWVKNIDDFVEKYVNTGSSAIIVSSKNATITRSGDILMISNAYVTLGNFCYEPNNDIFESENFVDLIVNHSEREFSLEGDVTKLLDIQGNEVVGLLSIGQDVLEKVVSKILTHKIVYINNTIDVINVDAFRVHSETAVALINKVVFEQNNGNNAVFRLVVDGQELDTEYEFGGDYEANANTLANLRSEYLASGEHNECKLIRVK